MRAWKLVGGGWLAQESLYSEEARGIRAPVHGDDVTVIASMENAEWLLRKFRERYETKKQMIGEAADLDKQLQILNRTVRWSSRGFWMESDPRHVKEVIKASGLEGASPAPTPGVAAKGTRVSARRTRPEEDEEGGSVSRWKATSWVCF